MTDFRQFRDILNNKIATMSSSGQPVYRSGVDTQVLRALYLDSFPEGTNKIFRERREYDCSCCLQFIRDVGAMVTINDGMELETIWDIQVGGYYQPVVDALSAFVKQHPITDFFLNDESHIGEVRNFELIDGEQKEWNHFYAKLPNNLVLSGDKIPSKLGALRTNFEMLERSLKEISLESAEIVLELIEQNSLYRGEEKRGVVTNFIKAKREYDSLPEEQRVNHCWRQADILGSAGRFRGDVIGTLLEDLSEGIELGVAVKKFEDKVSGTNYQRPTALVTPGMVKKAQQAVADMGLSASLERRFAAAKDLTINNVLFADRSVRPAMKDVFDDLLAESKKPTVSLDKVEKISIKDFMTDVLPKVTSMEVLFSNKHKANLVSLLAPVDETSPNMFKWGNPFSWSYSGEVADAIKERVKSAGGNVEGDMRVSLAWHNPDDLDLHIYEPGGSHIYFPRHSRTNRRTGGTLDVDMNGMDQHDSKNPVENVTWPDESRLSRGTYKIVVNQYNARSRENPGFTVELDFKGKVYTFNYPKLLKSGENVLVAEFTYSRSKGVIIKESIDCLEKSSEEWGIRTEEFHRVKMVLNSPNHWDGEETGNKHYFFVIEDCLNPNDARGFYNEFLKPELQTHRKVFELLAGKMKAKATEEQLSGLGFSSTVKNSVFVKVGGSFNRVLELTF